MSQTHSDERESTRASLKAWWSSFTKSGKSTISKDRKATNERVFGEPLRTSLKYASVAISMAGEDGNQYVWGYVPIIVAKVGLFLKEKATEVEGVFRIAGSQKRMRDLQETFDTGPKYGKNVVWERYSVHDAASVLRRYLNQMPEPIVPLDLYSEFRNVMHKQPLDVEAAIKTYRLLIQSMPSANRYLLLYVLDLLAVFARKSEINLMPSSNLAVIFQPGIFSHPSHLQDANEHKTAVEVLQFLIDHQDNFLIKLVQPPTTNIDNLDLTSVSVAATGQMTPDVAELSESDEELGVLTIHEGGGARLARRSTSAGAGPSGKKSGGFFRSRKGVGSTPASYPKTTAAAADSSPSPEEDETAAPSHAAEGSSLAVSPKTDDDHLERRKTPSPMGDLHELELTQSLSLTGGGANLRRSRTVPSRRVQEGTEGEKRSVSGSKVALKHDHVSPKTNDDEAPAAVEPQADTASKAESKAEVAPVTEAEAEQKATPQEEPEAKQESEPEADAQTEAEQRAEPEPKPEAEAEEKPEAEAARAGVSQSETGLATPPPSKLMANPSEEAA